MTKDLTTVTQNRIKYWQWTPYGTLFYKTRNNTGYWRSDKLKWQEHVTDFKETGEDVVVPDSAIILLGIPLAYT